MKQNKRKLLGKEQGKSCELKRRLFMRSKCKHAVLVTALICNKILPESNSGGEAFIFSHSLRVQSVMAGEPGNQENEVVGHCGGHRMSPERFLYLNA